VIRIEKLRLHVPPDTADPAGAARAAAASVADALRGEQLHRAALTVHVAPGQAMGQALRRALRRDGQDGDAG
jgi:hypothetical protein